MTDEQRKAIRMVLSGQDERPVTLETDPGGGDVVGPAGGHGDGVMVSPDEVLVELEKHDPQLLELLALRAFVARHVGAHG